VLANTRPTRRAAAAAPPRAASVAAPPRVNQAWLLSPLLFIVATEPDSYRP